jgi:hypothetical protein
MPNIKHVGRLKNNKRRLVVPYRTIPNDPYHCLVVFVDTLSADEHDSLMRVTESAAGQSAYELAEVMDRTFLSDGRNMLVGFYKTGKLQKIATADVEMIPNATSALGLDELNKLIADQRGVSLEDLSIKSGETKTDPAPVAEVPAEPVVAPVEPAPLTDEDLARKYRSDADRLSKEAANLRRMAEDLVPTKKTTAKKTESA